MQLNKQHFMKHDNVTIVIHMVRSTMKKTQRFTPTIICNLNSPLIPRGIMDTISHPPVQPLNPKEAKIMYDLPTHGVCVNPQQPNMQKGINKAYCDFSTLIFRQSACLRGGGDKFTKKFHVNRKPQHDHVSYLSIFLRVSPNNLQYPLSIPKSTHDIEPKLVLVVLLAFIIQHPCHFFIFYFFWYIYFMYGFFNPLSISMFDFFSINWTFTCYPPPPPPKKRTKC
jgi:hypothetical protein